MEVNSRRKGFSDRKSRPTKKAVLKAEITLSRDLGASIALSSPIIFTAASTLAWLIDCEFGSRSEK